MEPHERPILGRARGVDIWGGVECTVNRVGDEYFDQLERSGHARRLDDLRRIAALGIRTLRFPILWERTAPDGVEGASWAWADERMALLHELGVRPIVGLVHHGSGPHSTSLLDPAFPRRLAAFARAVAERYPWVDLYTPINEPLTTARFSGLYGLWYPHARSSHAFLTMLCNECRATSLAMRAIREVNPAAQLVQTEDLGKTHSTPKLAYQARHENHRRWLSFDLLRGEVDERHPLWSHVRYHLRERHVLDWLREHPVPPDVLGINYYVTSERFLDERIERYPGCVVGGNRRHRYVDVEAVRVLADGPDGPERLLREVWQRYRSPIAVTEAHLGCGRAEQVRWFDEIHGAACRLREEGVDLRAVTAWALLGAYDWHSLVTRCEGRYEPGVFDVRGGAPRPTALAQMVREIIERGRFEHPVLGVPGWWRRPDRLEYPEVAAHRVDGPKDREVPAPVAAATRARPLLVTGAHGTLGQAFARLCALRGLPYRLLTRAELDIADRDAVARVLDEVEPWALINTAGYVRVDAAERDAERCFRENTAGPAVLAAACAARGVSLVTFSSDLVFDGRADSPYSEADPVAPLNVYGRSKAEAEARVLEANPRALVVRTSAFFGPWDEHNYVTRAIGSLVGGRAVVTADDTRVSPTYIPDLIDETLDLLVDGESGIWHLANDGAVSWYELLTTAARMAGLDPTRVIGRPSAELGLVAPRPRATPLVSRRGAQLPSLEHALVRYFPARHAHAGPADAAGGATEAQAPALLA